jgi:hypothetical protein
LCLVTSWSLFLAKNAALSVIVAVVSQLGARWLEYRPLAWEYALAVHVGTSGWSYQHWEQVLYPPGCPPAERLAHYVREFGTAELNASFYRWPAQRSFAGWRRRLPAGFVLSVKAPRGLTHSGRLRAGALDRTAGRVLARPR